MKKTHCYILLLLLFLSSCQSYSTFDEMAQAMCVGKGTDVGWKDAPSTAVWIDVRERNEFQVSHIAQARCWPMSEIEQWPLHELDADRPIVVYCSVGYRSEKAAVHLMDKQSAPVYNLYGGIFGVWNDGQLKDESGNQVLQIHGYNEKWSAWITHGKIVYE